MIIEPTDQLADELAEGGSWLLDLVAAVDYLRRGIRPGITVWDALGESLRWLLAETDSSPDSPDAIAAAIVDAMAANAEAPISIQTAIRRWVLTMADRYNDGHHWPHPAARRGYPPPSALPAEDSVDRPATWSEALVRPPRSLASQRWPSS